MSRLEGAVTASSSELKAAAAAREGLEKAQQGLVGELNELMGAPGRP
jgi:hypothetical protein